jgi:hypothetical protein
MITVNEFAERSMSELTDAELDAVCGGGFFNLPNIVTQTNTAVQVGLNFGGGLASPASIAQLIGQANFSF